MKKVVADRLQSIRKSKGLKGEYMAEQLGVAVSTYSNYETGKTNISVDRLYQIAKILDINIHDLFPSNKITYKYEDSAQEKIDELTEAVKAMQKQIDIIQGNKPYKNL